MLLNLTASHFTTEANLEDQAEQQHIQSSAAVDSDKENHKTANRLAMPQEKTKSSKSKTPPTPEHNRHPLLQMGADAWNQNAPDLDISGLRKELEGPMPLRAMCGFAGFALTVCACLGMLNLPAMVTHPARFLLQIYEAVFGLVICGVELKDASTLSGVREIAYKWMPFLSVVGGKGAFYIFVGSLGAAFGFINMLIFVPAMVVLACGVILVLYHFGHCRQLGEKYDMTVYHSSLLNATQAPQN
eukprot:Lankesteria_metandrocarpae@DN3220_c0_g1_i3.p1